MPAIDPNTTRRVGAPKPPARRVPVALRPSPPPVTDVQSSGGNYGSPKANKFKRTATYKRSLAVAKQAKQQFPQRVLADVKQRAQHGEFEHVLYATQPSHVGHNDWRGPGFYQRKSGTLGLAHFWAKAQPVLNPDGSFAGQFKTESETVKSQEHRGEKNAQIGSLTAPAVKAILYAGRPGRAVEGAIGAALSGKNVTHAASEGLLHGKGPTGSDILGKLGVHNKTLKAILGTGLDITTDPTTYATAGLAAPAKVLAEKEATRVAEKALAHGMTPDLAERLGRQAAKRATANAATNKGVQIGARARLPFTDVGFDAKTSGRATAAVARKTGLSKVAGKAGQTDVAQTTGRSIVHDFRQAHVTPEQHTAVRAALAAHRAQTRAGEAAALRSTKALTRAVGGRVEEKRIIDLIESGQAHTDPVAAQVARELNVNTRQLAKRGLARPFRSTGPDDAQAYFPHVRNQDLLPASERATSKALKSGTTTVAPLKGRGIRKSLAVIRQDATKPFSEDLASVVGAHMTKSARQKALSDLWQKVAKTGTEVRPGRRLDLADMGNQLVYKVTPHGLKPLVKEGGDKLDLKALQDVIDGKASGRHVVLDKRLVEDIKGRLAHTAQGDRGLFRYFDKATGKWKTAVTVLNPSYHGRNLIGDVHNAVLAGTRLRDFPQSGKALHALEVRNRAEASAEHYAGAGAKTAKAQRLLARPVKLGKAGEMTMDELLKEAEQQGAIRTGFVGGEVTQLAGEKGAPGVLLRKVGVKTKPAIVRTANEYREDFPRLASYISARKHGLTPEAAAQHVATHHFDYADLTPFERQSLRRVVPFYTFFARNTRLQITKLLTQPGKYAALSHILDEAAKAAGFTDYYDFAQRLPDSQQRGIPVPVKVNGQVLNLYAGLPATDLNQFSVDAGSQVRNFANRLSPIKVGFEIYFNYSLFFQGQIENPTSPKVAAPVWAAALPGFLKSKLGVAKILDKRTGRMVWGWDSKADYIARQLPQSNLVTGLATQTAGSRGQTPLLAALSQSGVRVAPAKLQDATVNQLYSQLTRVQARLGTMRQEGQDRTGTAYQTLLAKQRDLQRRIYQAKSARGDKVLPKQGASSSGGLPSLPKLQPLPSLPKLPSLSKVGG